MDIKDIKNVLMEKIAPIVGKFSKKKAEGMQEDQDYTANAQQPSSSPPAGGEKTRGIKLLTLASMVVICFVVGGVLAYNFYFSYEKDVQPQLKLSSPVLQSVNTANTSTPTGDTPVKNEQAQGEQSSAVPQKDTKPVSHTEPNAGVQEKAKKAAPVRVSEHDPFKSEFEKKYQTALKKEKGLSGSLSDLEGSIKETKLNLPPPPSPPPPAPKQLKLAVYGTVVSSKDTYAITDMGVIRVGNVVEAFTVESIKFDMVTLRQNDNKDEIRSIFVKQDRSRQPGAGGDGMGGQQWPSSR